MNLLVHVLGRNQYYRCIDLTTLIKVDLGKSHNWNLKSVLFVVFVFGFFLFGYGLFFFGVGSFIVSFCRCSIMVCLDFIHLILGGYGDTASDIISRVRTSTSKLKVCLLWLFIIRPIAFNISWALSFNTSWCNEFASLRATHYNQKYCPKYNNGPQTGSCK